jgi:hypothetical protein
MGSVRYVVRLGFSLAALLTPLGAHAQNAVSETTGRAVGNTGVSALWILANISYAGMRAQSNPSTGWRILSFIFGFPGTLVSFFVISGGSDRAYGIDIPK